MIFYGWDRVGTGAEDSLGGFLSVVGWERDRIGVRVRHAHGAAKDLYSWPLGTWGKLAVVFFNCSNWLIIRLLPYLFLSWPSRRRSSARDQGVALYCSLLLNRSLEVQADLYLKAPSCKVFIWSLLVCMLVTPQIRLSYNRSNMRIATHKHLLVLIVGGNWEFSRSFLYSTHLMVCQNHGL